MPTHGNSQVLAIVEALSDGLGLELLQDGSQGATVSPSGSEDWYHCQGIADGTDEEFLKLLIQVGRRVATSSFWATVLGPSTEALPGWKQLPWLGLEGFGSKELSGAGATLPPDFHLIGARPQRMRRAGRWQVWSSGQGGFPFQQGLKGTLSPWHIQVCSGQAVCHVLACVSFGTKAPVARLRLDRGRRRGRRGSSLNPLRKDFG